MEDIAIIGLACRFPGEATSLKNLWDEVLAKGKSTWSEFPPDRFNVDGFHHPDNQRQGSLSFRGAHFLKEDVGTFDCSFFDMNPNDAIAADPQQRKLMEVSFEALQNAGVKLEDMAGTNTGVYIASFVKDYEKITHQDSHFLPQYAATGTANALLANRLSYFYNVSGPSMTVDTACSGSLLAVHLAAQSLRTHETSMAIVGGSNLILSPHTMFPMDQMGFLSPDGKCFTFDSRANGYGRGEGVGVVVMKRLSDAIEAKDTIRAVIRGSRVNHDGRTPGITMPSKNAQAQNIRELYESAGLDPNATGYVECHGTGTKAGDPTELTAITETLCAQRSKDNPLLVGSIKTNIGHLEGASGVAGLIKSVLCLEKGMIPPNTNFETPNPAIHFNEWKLKVPLELTPWPMSGGPRRISINSFGFGGTNVHVILDDSRGYLAERGLDGIHCSAAYPEIYQSPESPREVYQDSSSEDGESSDFLTWTTAPPLVNDIEEARNGGPTSPALLRVPTSGVEVSSPGGTREPSVFGDSSDDSGDGTEVRTPSTSPQPSSAEPDQPRSNGTKIVFPLSCDNKAVFPGLVENMIAYLRDRSYQSPGHLRDYAHTLALRSSAFKWRACFIDDSATGLIRQFQDTNAGNLVQAAPKPKGVCFVFGGQGGVWAEMGRDLLCFKPFRESLKRANTFMRSKLRCPFDLFEELQRPRSATMIACPFVSQPATTALQIALVDLLHSFGIEPQYVVGHSSGEIAAAYAASALSCSQAWALAYFRGLHAVRLARKCPHIKGGMIAVGMSAQEATEYLSQSPSVGVACINSPTLVTLSGDQDDIDMIAADLTENGVFHKILDIPVAYHSRHMDLIAEDYKASIHAIIPDSPRDGPVMLSSLRGRMVDPSELDLDYWAQNLTSQVRFSDALGCLEKVDAQRRPDVFIEIGPSNGMRRPTLDTVTPFYSPSSPPQYLSLLKTGVRGTDVFLGTLGRCWVWGLPVRLHDVLEQNANFTWLGRPRHLPDVPVQPWDHSRRFWHESHRGKAFRSRSEGRKDLVGVRSLDSNEYRSTWNHFLRLHENPWIRDHQIQKIILYPAAGMVTMVIEGFNQLVSDRETLAGFYIEAFTIERPMVVPESDHGLEVSMVLSNLNRDNLEYAFDIHSKHLNGQWQKNASGRIMLRRHSDLSSFEFAQYRSRWTSLGDKPQSTVHPSQLYAAVEDQGLNYGPAFRNITSSKVISGDTNASRACISTIKVPDTKSKMPRQFEHPHFIHPATLDSMMQTLFAVYPAGMVPTSIDKIWVSARLVGEAGVEFEGHSVGVEEGTSGALGTIAMTAEGWDVPSVVMDGARFTKMARLSVEKGGHIPLRRDLTSEIVWKEDITLAKIDNFEKLLSLLAHKHPGLSVLQIGLDVSLTERILGTLHPLPKERRHLSRYTVSGDDGGVETLEKIQELYKDCPVLDCIEARQYSPGSNEEFPNYNLIVADCTSTEVPEDLQRRLLPGGFLLQLVNQDVAANDGIESAQTPRNSRQYSEKRDLIHCSAVNLKFRLHREKSEIQGCSSREVFFLVPDRPSALVQGMVSELRKVFMAKGVKVAIIRLGALLRLASGSTRTSFRPATINDGAPCVSFLSAQEDDDFVFSWSRKEFEAFKHLVKKTKAILWLTRNVYITPSNPRASLIVGIARTLMSEDSEKKIVTLDFGGKRLATSWASLCLEVFERSFSAEQAIEPRDVEYATDGERLLIPRLRPLNNLNKAMDGTSSHEVQEVLFTGTSTERLRIVLNGAGTTDDLSCWKGLDKYEGTLASGEVEIQFVSAPLLDEDYDAAFGRTILTSLGLDICGRVTNVGDGIHDLKTGDLVVGISLQGAFQNTVRLDRGLVAKVPGNDTDLGSKFFLSCYLSAWYAIHPTTEDALRRKIFGREGRSVLIHHATSAHGQTAVILAQALELEVYVTAGTDDMAALRKLGIRESGIIPLGALSRWDGKVDVVYDPTGSLFSQSAHHVRLCYSSLKQHSRTSGALSALRAPSGGYPDLIRHVDLRSILANEDIQFSAKNIIAQIQCKANHGLIAIGAMNLVETRDLSRMNSTLTEAADVYPRGRIFSMSAGSDTRVPVAVSKRVVPLSARLSPSGSYVLVGAFGGVGEMIADLLVRGGAKSLVFLSRRGADSPQAQDLCDKLQKRGVEVVTYAVDVADQAALKAVWKSVVRRARVLGVVQCAAVFKDGIFENMTYDDWVTSTRPKTLGSWNLFSALQASSSTLVSRLRQKPWMLFLSSASGVIGNRGQANYAAGNVFQDALAHHAKHHGFHAASLDFGPILGAGVLERHEHILDTLRASGFFGIQPEDFLAVAERAICGEVAQGEALPTQIVVGVGTGGLVRQINPSDPYFTRTAMYSVLSRVDLPPGDLSDLSGSKPHGASHASSAENTIEAIARELAALLAKNMNMKLEDVDLHKPLEGFGVDSLVATAVRGWIFARTQVAVSPFELMGEKSIDRLATMLVARMGKGKKE